MLSRASALLFFFTFGPSWSGGGCLGHGQGREVNGGKTKEA